MTKITLKDSFDAVNKIKNIPPHLVDDRYNYVLFLCGIFIHKCSHQKNHKYHSQTNLHRQSCIYQLKKHSMKKFLLGTCTKTAFAFSGVIYEQRDGICIGSSLGPLLAKIIITDLEEKVIKPLD